MVDRRVVLRGMNGAGLLGHECFVVYVSMWYDFCEMSSRCFLHRTLHPRVSNPTSSCIRPVTPSNVLFLHNRDATIGI